MARAVRFAEYGSVDVLEVTEVDAPSPGAGELMVVTITHDPQVRRHSYELIAAAFELEGRVTARPQPATV